MKEIIFILSYISMILFCGCSSLNDQQLDTRKTGIVDACYTVIQYNPTDKKQRVQTYLNKKVQEKLIIQEQKIIIIKCLNRTQNSSCWRYNTK